MEIIQLTDQNHQEVIEKAMVILGSGSLVIYPTETCYGIGADATNQEAVDRVLAYKTKRQDNPLSVAVANKALAEKYVEVNKTAENIYKNFLPGPVTVVSRGKHLLAKGIESSMGTQGIRIPDHAFLLNLLGQYQKPITSTSANASYKKTPYCVDDILDNISEKQKGLIGLIIDAGQLPKAKPSTVVDTTLDNIHIVRDGGLKFDKKEEFVAHSLEETTGFVHQLVKRLAPVLGKKNIVFLLEGDLGAGKTHFSKALGKTLGIQQVMTSPTFIICHEYQIQLEQKRAMFFHMDTYRLYEANEIDDLRPDRLFAAPNIIVIEWANKVEDYVAEKTKDSIVIKMKIDVVENNARHFVYDIQGL